MSRPFHDSMRRAADRCPWRRVAGDGSSAECDLVAELIGTRDDGLAEVSDDACAACCGSFVPAPDRLNSVVAALVYGATSRLIERAGDDARDTDEAVRVRSLAESCLKTNLPDRYRLTPARETRCCCWRGDSIVDEPREADRSEGTRAATDGERLFACRHPAHERTTESRCRVCRDWEAHPGKSRFLELEELIPPPPTRSGPAVRRWGVGVTTAPRRELTLEACLDSVVRAGWEEPHLLVDGRTVVPTRYEHLPITWRDRRIGAWPAWYAALGELVFQQPDADAYLLLQDDAVLYGRQSTREYLERWLWPGDRPGLVSLFCSRFDPTPGWRLAGSDWHWGAQGFVFPPGVARALLCDSDLAREWLAAAGDNHIPIPSLLYEWVRRVGVDVWFANPSLTQHIGNTSTIWRDATISEGRRAPWFAGSVETVFAAEESFTDFPEDDFPCAADRLDDYRRRVESGYARMRDSTVVLCGLGRDVRHFLPRTAARVERLGDCFGDYRVVLYENDSEDATREFLEDWRSSNPRVEVLSESLGAPRHPRSRSLQRAAWMARCRNLCREHVVERYADYDYVVVFDADLPGGWSYDGIAHTFGQDDWDFVGSYGLMRHPAGRSGEAYSHFDVWAFHPAPGTPARNLVDHTRLRLSRGDPLLPVESCFGGLGVYRSACMRRSAYGGEDCEHVVLHERLRRAGFDRLFLNPNQIVLYSP